MHILEMRISHIDVNTKKDTKSVTASSEKPWCELDDFLYDRLAKPYSSTTLENNYNVLDGSMVEFPDNTDDLTWGLFSDEQSNKNGEYENPVTLRVAFSAPHKSRGLSLHYYSDTGYTLQVTWFSDTAFTEIIKSGEYKTTSLIGDVREIVSNYRSIEIKVIASDSPYRYVKMWAIDYGVMRIILDNEINKCITLEEIDPTSECLSYNTLRANIRTLSSFISPITSPDFDNMLMELQPIYVLRDGEPFGTFFMNTWEDVYQTGIEFDVTADDAISILDRYPHMGGIYDKKPVVDLLDYIFDYCFPTGIVTYVLDPNFEASTVSGWIPIGTCALALQHICCALNATVNVGRDGDVHIYPREIDAKQDSTLITKDIQPWADINDLKSYSLVNFLPTMELNYTALDGVLNEFPDKKGDLLYGWISQSKADENGVFEVPPTIDITFNTSRNSQELSFNFGAYEKEYISKMRVTFYDEVGNALLSEEYEFTANPAKITDKVYGYRRILIEVLEMSAPHRHARIAAIEYGRSYYIPLERQYRSGRDNPTPFVSGVRVTSHRYTKNNVPSRIFEDVLPKQDTIEFPEPMHTLTCTGGTIIASDANYAIVKPNSATGIVTLDGCNYTDNKRVHAVDAESEAGRIETLMRYERYTLISPDIGDARARDLFEHLRLPIKLETDIVLDDVEVAYVAQIQTRGNDVAGVIQHLESNLRANTAKMVVIGNVVRAGN